MTDQAICSSAHDFGAAGVKRCTQSVDHLRRYQPHEHRIPPSGDFVLRWWTWPLEDPLH